MKISIIQITILSVMCSFPIVAASATEEELNKKIEALNNFTEYNLKSTLRDDAYYELGNSYVRNNEIH